LNSLEITRTFNCRQNNRLIICSVCFEKVSGIRFAPHLEKCLNGGKRGGYKSYVPMSLPNYKVPKVVVEHLDPYPNSLIIKIKMKNGMPISNQERTGTTIEEFDLYKSRQR